MGSSGGVRIAICIAGIFCLVQAGCISHDQVHLPNPAPCRITCEHDGVAPLDPVCYGYHPTCWRAWCGGCPACPAPNSAVTPHELPENLPPPQTASPSESLLPGPSLNRAPRLDAIPERDVPGDAMPAPSDRNVPLDGSRRPTPLLHAADSPLGNVLVAGPTLEEAKSSIEGRVSEYLQEREVSLDVWPESLWDCNRCQALIWDKVDGVGSGLRQASFP
jgi:hypothetical protein